jgi:hypothetical protein
MRDIVYSKEFRTFFDSLQPKVKAKILSSIEIIHEMEVISSKLIKKLTGTNYYELRVSMDNEYRILLFAIDHDNIMKATTVYFLNGFVKKSTKDYRKQIVIADNILNRTDL